MNSRNAFFGAGKQLSLGLALVVVALIAAPDAVQAQVMRLRTKSAAPQAQQHPQQPSKTVGTPVAGVRDRILNPQPLPPAARPRKVLDPAQRTQGMVDRLKNVPARKIPRPGLQPKGEQEKERDDSLRDAAQMKLHVSGAVRAMAESARAASPGIHDVNGKKVGLRFTPGGQYVITGKGFGSNGGDVFLTDAALGRTVRFDIEHWSDSEIYASLGNGISGVRDVKGVTLVVGPRGLAAFKSTMFGFIAARETITLKPEQMKSAFVFGDTHPKGQCPNVDSNCNDTGAPSTYADYAFVSRSTWMLSGSGLDKLYCYQPGRDVLHTAGLLKNGYVAERFDFVAQDGISRDTDNGSERFAGHYAAEWSGQDVVVDWGVQRTHYSGYVGMGADDYCSSAYEFSLIVTGPRGLPPI